MSRFGRRHYTSDLERISGVVADPFRGSELLAAVLLPGADAGGRLIYGWLAQGPQNFGAGYLTAWTETSVAAANYAVTTCGGPYVELDGANDYLTISDPAWAEPGAEELWVWAWVYATSYSATMQIVGKDSSSSHEWGLRYYHSATEIRGGVSGDGSTMVYVGVGYTLRAEVWYFVSLYYEPSSIVQMWIAAASDGTLTTDSTTSSVPASIYSGSANLAIGANSGGTNPWAGRIGIQAAWANVPSTAIDDAVERVFLTTRRFYMG